MAIASAIEVYYYKIGLLYLFVFLPPHFLVNIYILFHENIHLSFQVYSGMLKPGRRSSTGFA